MFDFLFDDRPQRQRQWRPEPKGKGRQKITFVISSGAPYAVVQYLESLGVKVWPTHDIGPKGDGTMEATVLVNAGQYAYAAGLIEGYPGFKVVDPFPVRAIRPRSRWGKTNNRARGLLTSTLRPLSGFLGVEAKKPPVKGRRRRGPAGASGSSYGVGRLLTTSRWNAGC